MENISVSREASNAFKGLLILLIVLGHNSILCRSWDGCQPIESLFIWKYLYTFHVYCFFILPFFYNKKPYIKGNIRKYAIRLLYPYLWISLLCLLISTFAVGNDFKGWGLFFWALCTGSGKLLEQSMSFNFPWFLPCMFTLLLLKDVYYSSEKLVRRILIGIGLTLWAVVLLGGIKLSTIESYVPFALVPAFRFLPICLLTVWLAERIKVNVISRGMTILIFALLSLAFWCSQTYDISTGRIAFYFVMPIAAFLTLFSFKKYLAKCHLLAVLGKMSLQIYLYHVIVFNILLVAVKHFHCPPTWIDGVIVLLITLVVSYIGAWCSTRIPFLQKILYPSSIKYFN